MPFEADSDAALRGLPEPVLLDEWQVVPTSAPDARSAAHLRWLREQVGDRFVLGIVWHTGPATYQLDERVFAAPIASLWA